MPAPLTPAQRLTRLKATFPDGAHMARALSISVRAEPELVRQVRLILFAGSGAELEADLYFSPFVAQRTPDWILLDPLLTAELQEESARLIGDSAGERQRMALVRQAVLQAHSLAPSDITCEEDVIWLAVERSGGREQALEAIEKRLRGPLVQLLRRSEESIAVARWFASAARRMPMLARETQAFALLAFAASSALGGRKIEAGASAGLETFDELARYLGESVKRVPLWMALTSRGLHLSFSERRGHERVDVPLTDPVLLEVRGPDSERTLVQVTPGAPLLVPLAPGPVTVRTLVARPAPFQTS